MSLPNMNFLHHRVSKIKPGQDRKGEGCYVEQNHTILHTYTLLMSLPNIKILHLRISEIYHGQDYKGQGHYSKVKGKSDHDTAHIHYTTSVPTKYMYQLPTPYSLKYSPNKILTIKVTMVRSIQGYTMALPIHTPKQYSQQAGSTIPIREMLPDVT